MALAIGRCRRCPRLVRHRERAAREKRRAYRDCAYWGRGVPGFGPAGARMLIVGLAPAAHGGNRTGRMFTGDGSASFLMRALHRNGLASRPASESRGDGLRLRDAYLTAIARCAPPDNRPAPREIRNCRRFLLAEIALLKRVRAVLALGRIALDGYLDALRAAGASVPRLPFAHGAEFRMPPGQPWLFVSYHPSRQNTQTGRLTPAMLAGVVHRAARFVRSSGGR